MTDTIRQWDYRTVAFAPAAERRDSGAEAAARALGAAISTEAARGWEYLRCETVEYPVKRGMLGKAELESHTILIFRRPHREAGSDPAVDMPEPPLARPSEPEARRDAGPSLGPASRD